MALSVGTVEHAEVVPGHDEDPLHHLGQTADPPGLDLALFWILHTWLGWLFLARRHPPVVLPSHAMFCEQSPSPQAGSARRSGFQPEHLVAGAITSHSMGRKLARQPSRQTIFCPFQPALVA